MKKIINIFPLIFLFACNLTPGNDESDSNKMEVKITPEVYIERLTDELSECSGLMWFNNSLWTLNDTGGENIIYSVGEDGEIVKRVFLEGAHNTDWESITHDEDFVYVGDFGNANGNREELKVYRISSEELNSDESEVSVKAESINFFYADQKDYSLKQKATEYDCEAMVSYGSNLYLFTKDWVYGQTKVYGLSKDPGGYELYPIDSFQVNGLITGGALHENYLALLGTHSYGTSFVIMVKFSATDTFSFRYVYFDLSSIFGYQPEGICFHDDQLIISTEATNVFSQKAFTFTYSKYLRHFD